MAYERLLIKENKPTDKDMQNFIGSKSSLWIDLLDYMKSNYDFTPEVNYFTKKYGWSIRYRRKGKTLCARFPEQGAFSILLVLGAKEVEKVDVQKLNLKVKDVFKKTEHFHDGRWLWIRVLTKSDLASFKLLLAAKKQPNNS